MNYEIKFRLTIVVSESTNKSIFYFYHFHISKFSHFQIRSISTSANQLIS